MKNKLGIILVCNCLFFFFINCGVGVEEIINIGDCSFNGYFFYGKI